MSSAHTPADEVRRASPTRSALNASLASGAAELLNLVVVGHVDHGKSTIIGRLLADTDSLPDGRLEQITALCERTARPFEYAFLLDALRDERAQGITIDTARVFFQSARRHYVLIDAPGHQEFLKNMVSGAARADAAFLVVDVHEGVRENSRRHGYLLAMLGIRQVACLVNKMDLVQFARGAFERTVRELSVFLERAGVHATAFVPVSGAGGDNVARRSTRMPWYDGPTALEVLDSFEPWRPAVERPLRLPVQDVYKFTERGDDRRIIAGTLDSGTLCVGDDVVFYPSGKRGRVKTIEAFHRALPARTEAGHATGFTLDEQVYVARGEVATRASEAAPRVSRRLGVSLFWLGRRPLVRGRDYVLKLGTARTVARIERIERVIDAADLSVSLDAAHVGRHAVADCVLRTRHPIAVDLATEHLATSRFVLVDEYEISGGGIVRATTDIPLASAEPGGRPRRRIPAERRAARLGHRSALVLISGDAVASIRDAALRLERALFDRGCVTALLWGGDAVAPLAGAMLDAGLVVLVAATVPCSGRDGLAAGGAAGQVTTVWAGDSAVDADPHELRVTGRATEADIGRIAGVLRDRVELSVRAAGARHA
jgi:bifunctional enzyme CysN/CysC